MKKTLAFIVACLMSFTLTAAALAEAYTNPAAGEEVAQTNIADEDYTQIEPNETPLGAGAQSDILHTSYVVCQAYAQRVKDGSMKSADIEALETVFKGDIWAKVKQLPLEEQAMALLVTLGNYDMVISSEYAFTNQALEVFKDLHNSADKFVNQSALKKLSPITSIDVNGQSVPYVAYQLKLVENNGNARLEQYGFGQTTDQWPLQRVATAMVNG